MSPHTAAWQEYARLRKLSAGTPGWSTPGRTLAMEAVAGVSPALSPGEAEVAAPYNPWLEYARLRKLSEDALCLTPPLPPARRRDCWWDRGVMVVEPLHEVRPRGSPRPPPLPAAARVRTPPRRRDGGWAWPAWAPAWAMRAAPPREDVVGVASLLAQLMLAGAPRACPVRALCVHTLRWLRVRALCVPCACPVRAHCPCTVLALCVHTVRALCLPFACTLSVPCSKATCALHVHPHARARNAPRARCRSARPRHGLGRAARAAAGAADGRAARPLGGSARQDHRRLSCARANRPSPPLPTHPWRA